VPAAMTAMPATVIAPLTPVPVPPPVAGAPTGKSDVAWTAAAAPGGVWVGAAAGVEGAPDVSADVSGPPYGSRTGSIKMDFLKGTGSSGWTTEEVFS
jgi:hypothetical protein